MNITVKYFITIGIMFFGITFGMLLPTIADAVTILTDQTARENRPSGTIMTPFFDTDLNETINQPNLIEALEWVFPSTVIGVGGLFGSVAHEEGLPIVGNFGGLGNEPIDVASTIGNSSESIFAWIVGTKPFSSLTY